MTDGHAVVHRSADTVEVQETPFSIDVPGQHERVLTRAHFRIIPEDNDYQSEIVVEN
jgi:hypothetical protein